MSVDHGKPYGGPSMGPQHFAPRGMPVQQHNIMGQPFIELRHRAPENRLRLPFGPAGMQGNPMDPHAQQHRLPGFSIRQQMGFPPNQGPSRPMDGTMMNQPHGTAPQMQMSSSMDSLNQLASLPGMGGLQQPPLMRSMSQPASNKTVSVAPANLFPGVHSEQSDEMPISSTEGEKLDADESAVKDLEDVEVKDLVDADLDNLNLDPDDGKDLDLETNDLHLDDFLTSGKFDIIAYTDADLDIAEGLDLSDPIEDHSETCDPQKTLPEDRNASSGSGSASTKGQSDGIPEAPTFDIKQEVCQSRGMKEDPDIKSEVDTSLSQDMTASGDIKSSNLSHPGASRHPQSGSAPDSSPVLSGLLVKEKPGDLSLKQADTSSALQSNPEMSISNVLDQGNFPQQGLNPGLALEQAIGSTHGGTSLGNPSQIQGQASDQAFGEEQQRAQDALLAEALQAGANLTPAQQDLLNQHRPLLLEEQPLLLQDLLDQERQEQQQQRQMQAMIRQRSSDSFFPNIGKSCCRYDHIIFAYNNNMSLCHNTGDSMTL